MLGKETTNTIAIGKMIREYAQCGQTRNRLQPIERLLDTGQEGIPILCRSIDASDPGRCGDGARFGEGQSAKLREKNTKEAPNFFFR